MQIGNRLRALAVLFALGAGATTATAQITTATVSGTVKDSTGGVVPGATVVLINEARGTRSVPAVTNATGDYVFPNVTPGTYTVEVTMDQFRTVRQTNVAISGGDRLAVPALTLEPGGAAETVNVTSEAPLIQASSGERSFTITTSSVENLPISGRNFASLTQLTPGVTGTTTRLGGGGQNNIMMDGVSTMDTGNNGQMLQMNVEAIAEVKVLTSGYQAEYGRSSGLQITAVTKSGTNSIRGSLYDVERDSDWNENTWANVKNNVVKTIQKERDLGYSIGGPIGKPGGNNKLFFFYSHEYRPRESGSQVNRFRVPTAAERAGDFSLSTDQNGAPIPNLIDYTTGAPFPGKVIPQGRLYQPGPGNPEPVAAAQYDRPELQLRSPAADGEHADPAAGRSHRLPADVELARDRQVRGPDAQRRSELDRRGGRAGRGHAHPRLQRLRGALSLDWHDLDHQQLHVEQHDVSRGDLRVGAEPARLDDRHAMSRTVSMPGSAVCRFSTPTLVWSIPVTTKTNRCKRLARRTTITAGSCCRRPSRLAIAWPTRRRAWASPGS